MNIKTHTAGLSYESDEKILTPNWIPLKELPKWNLLFLNPNQSHQRLKKVLHLKCSLIDPSIWLPSIGHQNKPQ